MAPLLLALLTLSHALSPALEEQSLPALAAETRGTATLVPNGQAVELEVSRVAFLMLPLPGATELVLDVTAHGVFTLSWMSEAGHAGPPWRYTRLDPSGTSRVRMNLLATEGWTASSRPVLRIDGSGTLTFHRLQARGASTDPDQAKAALDHAVLLAPESVGHTTINTLTPPVLATNPRRDLPTVIAGLGLLVALGLYLTRRQLARSLALGALVATLTFNAYMLGVRLYPLLRPPHVSVEQRIQRNYYFAADLGELAALARRTLPREARVGVLGRADDWFGPQTLCFNLWPRRCAIVHAGESEHRGIAGLGKLASSELDALVVYNANDALPEGFQPIVGVSPTAYVARRR